MCSWRDLIGASLSAYERETGREKKKWCAALSNLKSNRKNELDFYSRFWLAHTVVAARWCLRRFIFSPLDVACGESIGFRFGIGLTPIWLFLFLINNNIPSSLSLALSLCALVFIWNRFLANSIAHAQFSIHQIKPEYKSNGKNGTHAVAIAMRCDAMCDSLYKNRIHFLCSPSRGGGSVMGSVSIWYYIPFMSTYIYMSK